MTTKNKIKSPAKKTSKATAKTRIKKVAVKARTAPNAGKAKPKAVKKHASPKKTISPHRKSSKIMNDTKKRAVTQKKPVAKETAAKKVPSKKSIQAKAKKPVKAQAVKKVTAAKKPPVTKNVKASKKPAKVAVSKKMATPPAPALKPVVLKPEPTSTGVVLTSIAKNHSTRHKLSKRLSASELKAVEEKLTAARERLVGLVHGLRTESLVRHDEVNHEEDGTDAFIRISGLNRATTEQQQIILIDAALQAIKEGTYGLCEICGNRIEAARLEALPFVKTCIKCQAESEETPSARISARQKLWD